MWRFYRLMVFAHEDPPLRLDMETRFLLPGRPFSLLLPGVFGARRAPLIFRPSDKSQFFLTFMARTGAQDHGFVCSRIGHFFFSDSPYDRSATSYPDRLPPFPEYFHIPNDCNRPWVPRRHLVSTPPPSPESGDNSRSTSFSLISSCSRSLVFRHLYTLSVRVLVHALSPQRFPIFLLPGALSPRLKIWLFFFVFCCLI